MTPPRTKKLFISYRSNDAIKVDKIARDLGLLRYDDDTPRYATWQDKHNLPPASPNWWDAIVDAIIDCDVFVLNMSKASLQSEVCQAELGYAHKRNRPVVPVVLEGEFFLDPKSGKYNIAYWELVPDWLRDVQFLFYTGTDFYSRFQTAVELFERNWPRDINVPRPINPDSKSVHGSNHALYEAACDYAERLAFTDAEKHFSALVRRNDSDYADVAAEWLELLALYAELIEIDKRHSARFLFTSKWKAYQALFPKEFLDGMFDPKNFNGRNGSDAETPPSERSGTKAYADTKGMITQTPPTQTNGKKRQTRDFLRRDHFQPLYVAFYGPTLSGKTMLLRSFLQSMRREDTRIRLAGPDMQIRIDEKNQGSQKTWRPIPAGDPIRCAPTMEADVARYRILRTPKDDIIHTRAHHLSTSCHYLDLVDDRGLVFEPGMINNLSVGQMIAGRIEGTYYAGGTEINYFKSEAEDIARAWLRLCGANVIFVLLDILALEENALRTRAFSRFEWATFVARIAELQGFSMTESQNKIVAICCVKMDEPSLFRDQTVFELLGKHDPEAFIRSRFGQDMLNAIDSLRNTYGNDMVRIFLVSAAGWGQDNLSNHSHDDRNFVRDLKNWQPYDVIEPFRWVLNLNDLARVNSITSSVNPLWRILSAVNSRKNELINY